MISVLHAKKSQNAERKLFVDYAWKWTTQFGIFAEWDSVGRVAHPVC